MIPVSFFFVHITAADLTFQFTRPVANCAEAIMTEDHFYIDEGERAYTPNGTKTIVPGWSLARRFRPLWWGL